MFPLRYCLHNMRLYSDSTVLTEHTVIVSQGVIETVAADIGLPVMEGPRRDLRGMILSAGLVDLCWRVEKVEQLAASRKSSLIKGITDIALTATPSQTLALLKHVGLASVNQKRGATVLGIRIDCCGTERRNLGDLAEALTEYGKDIIDVRCLLTDPEAERITDTVHSLGGRICFHIPDHSDDCDLSDLGSRGPFACVSIGANSLDSVPEISKWIEVRMPTSGNINVRPTVAKRPGLLAKLLLGNHRIPDSDDRVDLWARLQREMYFATEEGIEYMPVNNAVLYMNRVWGVPMHKALAIATFNGASYMGQAGVLGRVEPGYTAHLSVLDRKLVTIDVIV